MTTRQASKKKGQSMSEDVIKLPADEPTPEPKPTKSHKKKNQTPGVVFLSHVPHGFYEKEMQGFFSQFGEVSRVRLSRNKKTGKSKHYAFVEFSSEDVAKIVAETMNGYILMNQVLKAKFVPPEEVHPKTFVGANQKFKLVPWRKMSKRQHDRERNAEEEETRSNKLVKKEKARNEKLKELGIDYQFTGYEEQAKEKTARPKHQKFD